MRVYLLRNSLAGEGAAATDFLPAEHSKLGDAPACEACNGFIGMRPLLAPLRVDVEAWGSAWGDIAFGPADQVLISDKAKELLESACLTGVQRVDLVHIEDARARGQMIDQVVPRYWLATVSRSSAILDEEASGVRRSQQPVCGECGLAGTLLGWQRVVIRSGTWSGEDVFHVRGLPGVILVSERLKYVVTDAGLGNFGFEPAESSGFEFLPLK